MSGHDRVNHDRPTRSLTLISLGCVICLLSSVSQTVGQDLWVDRDKGAAGIHLSSHPIDGKATLIEVSSDLRDWSDLAASNRTFRSYEVSVEGGSRFFRTRDWNSVEPLPYTNQLWVEKRDFIALPLTGQSNNAAAFVKFTIQLDDPTRVYFQDSERYPFHYFFVREWLEAFADISLDEYNRVSLFRENQQLVLGAVIVPSNPSIHEIGIQFVGQEAFAIEKIVEWFGLVRARLKLWDDALVFYLPSFEQQEVAWEQESWLADRGIQVGEVSRWIDESTCYSPGWTLGKVRSLEATEIDAAFASGAIAIDDILVTDQVPAELPAFAAVLTFQPATPNSHVVLHARSRGQPMVYVVGDALRQRLLALEGREILLVVESDAQRPCQIKLEDIDGLLTSEERAKLLAGRNRAPVDITPMERFGDYGVKTEVLFPEDIRYVGGKAANLGILTRTIVDNSPEKAIAMTFDLWMDFMNQPYGGETLGSWIQDEVASFQFPPDMVALRPVLETIRSHIREQTIFTDRQQALILSALSRFQEEDKIRFRSSTNVEDTEFFLGAGLYDSYSGCLSDDLDEDQIGPSRCDFTKKNERGVFRAIKKVFASFYNERAVIERLRYGIDESEVGMALLVHHSFPDERELANGVVTVEIVTETSGKRVSNAHLVSQKGAFSVANPDSGWVPEEVSARFDGPVMETDLMFQRGSSLLGGEASVLTWPGDYLQLLALLDSAAKAYEESEGPFSRIELDFEWKLVLPHRLVVKQIRQVPSVQDALEPPVFSD